MERPSGVLVTRSRAQAGRLSDALRARGLEPIELATIAFRAIDESAAELGRVDTASVDDIVFTSANGVRFMTQALAASGREVGDFGGARVSVAGPATAKAAEAAGWHVDLVPPRYVAESLVEAMIAAGVAGRRVLFPRARHARELLPNALRAAGADVQVAPVYESYVPPAAATTLAALRCEDITCLAFASSQTVRNFADAAEVAGRQDLREVPVAAIGPVTGAAAQALGLDVVVTPTRSTIVDFADAISAWHSASS